MIFFIQTLSLFEVTYFVQFDLQLGAHKFILISFCYSISYQIFVPREYQRRPLSKIPYSINKTITAYSNFFVVSQQPLNRNKSMRNTFWLYWKLELDLIPVSSCYVSLMIESEQPYILVPLLSMFYCLHSFIFNDWVVYIT